MAEGAFVIALVESNASFAQQCRNRVWILIQDEVELVVGLVKLVSFV